MKKQKQPLAPYTPEERAVLDAWAKESEARPFDRKDMFNTRNHPEVVKIFERVIAEYKAKKKAQREAKKAALLLPDP